MKKISTLTVALLAIGTAHAQLNLFKKDPANPGFSKAVEAILGDFPYNYKHLTGDLVLQEGELQHYASTVNLPGAETCIIAHYNSGLDTTASWAALMYHTEEFEDASKEYRRLFNQLNKCKLKMVDGSAYYLEGDFDEPATEKDFVISEFKIQTADERYKLFKVELEMLYKIDHFVVNINFVTRKKDADQRPDWWSGR
ncbi:hypothetical protein HHL16_14790 [Pseudoflavitalea sp. G-6-1-2]|uniref:hypothetical protein n=1 Tax=Pseudoflavitalea sp. G-6-1-2 TaxID=2728841 RepID=UPI00146A3859|nr:hypothetical protein [Pseudoflavitalea sp. G-6-1-2]NML22148.1 hypothetical protein [Pseudoflavitalea sp. G-6-1-2]